MWRVGRSAPWTLKINNVLGQEMLTKLAGLPPDVVIAHLGG